MSKGFWNVNEYLFTHLVYLINQKNKKGEPFNDFFFEKNLKSEPWCLVTI